MTEIASMGRVLMGHYRHALETMNIVTLRQLAAAYRLFDRLDESKFGRRNYRNNRDVVAIVWHNRKGELNCDN